RTPTRVQGVSFSSVGTHLGIVLPGGTALFTTRRGGVSEGPFASLNLGLWTDDEPGHVRKNRARVQRIGGGRLAQAHQVHGTTVVEADPDVVPEADGHVTAQAGVAPIVLVADCVPVALVAPEGVAMLHAGWRGLAGGILAEGVARLRGLGAGRIAAAIGPGAGPCCYEVGPEVHAALGTSGRTVDLKAIARTQLEDAGVAEVHDAGLCTMCDPEAFFSHRRDGGVTGRQAGVVWRS
ncbi:MAG: purine-nucleoside/S-methyl-5-thioadenosine phosphorylase / adenosine deaminase, partial [Solirubrobacteraceae bacterium]|nr:purine-nucleoside/S-methyl-5-thioadenosine phosphorylase / adenosine deaminase [Solirubrobacteraceae bacterium]